MLREDSEKGELDPPILVTGVSEVLAAGLAEWAEIRISHWTAVGGFLQFPSSKLLGAPPLEYRTRSLLRFVN